MTETWINSESRRTGSGAGSYGRGDPTATKKRRYGRSRARRRHGILVLLVIGAILVALPFALRVPDAVMRTTYLLQSEASMSDASEENDPDHRFVAGVIYTESIFRPYDEAHRD